MTFLEDLVTRAAATPRRIVFPESADERTLAAVRDLLHRNVVYPLLVLDPQRPETHEAARATGAEIVDPDVHPLGQDAARLLFERRRARGLSAQEAGMRVRTPLFFADALVALGAADGCVAGATHTTADVLRAALWLIGPAQGVRTVSSAFYMVTAPFRGGTTAEELTFTDCAVVPEPTSAQLADIAIAAARDRRKIVGDEPHVALLSFSTRGSGAGESVSRVQAAVAELRLRVPELVMDGELQGDAALVMDVAARKAPQSTVAGRANVLVFPSLDAGNIAYKLVQRLAGARAVGPIIQGLRRPCSDLSRGAAVDDIINVAAITALQAASSHDQESTEFR
jgi:phosphate acetyltransferase